MSDYRHSKLWSWRASRSAALPFRADAGELVRQDVRRRAMKALEDAAGGGAGDIEGPLWAMVDLSGGNERVEEAARWFRVAAAYGEDDALRADRCGRALEMMRRALRSTPEQRPARPPRDHRPPRPPG